MQHRIGNLFRELRNRSVIRALIAYAVIAWILLQVADITFDRLPIPDNAMTILIVLVIIGFPVTAILAWGYEITLRGIVRHEQTPGGAPRLAFLPYIIIVVVVSIGGGSLFYYLSKVYWEPARISIAVLPFTNNSDEPDTEYFSDGLTEEIQSLIVRLREFRVVALSTSIKFKHTVMDVMTVADRLGAKVVLQGSVRRIRDRVTVTARLIDGADGHQLWSNSYDREMSDIYGIQEDIARQVARALHVVLPVSVDRRLKNLGTRNVDAYDAYLRGIEYLRMPSDATTLLVAEGFLKEALALDPEYADAYSAMCKKQLAAYKLSRDAGHFGIAEQSCQRALEFSEESADVHLALGGLYIASGKNENALHEYEEALDENVNLADTYIGLAKANTALGRNDEAEAHLRRAIETDVSYWASFNAMGVFLFGEGRFLEAAEFFHMFINRADDDALALGNLGAAYYLAGDFKHAAEAWERSLEVKPTLVAYANTGSMYFFLGDFDRAADRYAMAANLAPNDYQMWGNLADAYYFSEDKKSAAAVVYKRALDLAEQRVAINANDPDALSDVAYYYSRLDERDKASAINAEALEQWPDNMYVYYNSALIHARFGETNEALTSLEHAVELEYQRELLPLDPAFAGLRNEERFRQLVSGNDP